MLLILIILKYTIFLSKLKKENYYEFIITWYLKFLYNIIYFQLQFVTYNNLTQKESKLPLSIVSFISCAV